MIGERIGIDAENDLELHFGPRYAAVPEHFGQHIGQRDMESRCVGVECAAAKPVDDGAMNLQGRLDGHP